jgi:diguanylate cyclase (GGDEF)-like protein/PAS domain S-box-containing protein
VHRALPGVTVQALAYETAVRGSLVRPSRALLAGTLSSWALLCAWSLMRVSWRVTPPVAAALIALVIGVSAGLYAAASVTWPIAPFIATVAFSCIGSLLSSLKLASWRTWQAQRSTRERDALLRQVVDRSSEAILTIDSSGRVRTANAPANALFGLDPAAPRDRIAPRDLLELLQALASGAGARELRLERDGKTIVLEVTCSELQWDADRITSITARDITIQKDRERELRHLAEHDALTQLPNRVQLNQRLGELLALRRSDEIVALLMLDLDGFKEVNDALGHSMGDTLLVALGARFAQLSTPQRLVARIGGDEFAIAWTGASRDEVAQLAQELLLLVQDPIPIKGVPVSLGTSVGIALSPDHASDSESLLKQADIALYVAKRRGTHVEFYDPSNDTHSPRRLEMLTSLRAAGANGELSLHYQPKIDLRSGVATEVEALCRWHNPTLGQVPPSEFIALAEASDLIKPLTEWTIRRALIDSHDWHASGIDLKVAVNLSARHLQDATLPNWLRELFLETRTRPEWLELEITESAIMTDPERSARILQSLRELGVTVSIDDFGTGYSSLAYLRSLAVDRLKLDRSFIATIDRSERDRVVVESTINLAHALGLQAIAEGIETQSQYDLLRELGCDVGQGYVIARPLPLPKLLEWHAARFLRRPETLARYA